jgi:hypothetical protein
MGSEVGLCLDDLGSANLDLFCGHLGHQCALPPGIDPTTDVAIAHVRRAALDADGETVPIDDTSVFSEMAMYVLVRRDGKWWLATGQNTPVRPKP